MVVVLKLYFINEVNLLIKRTPVVLPVVQDLISPEVLELRIQLVPFMKLKLFVVSKHW